MQAQCWRQTREAESRPPARDERAPNRIVGYQRQASCDLPNRENTTLRPRHAGEDPLPTHAGPRALGCRAARGAPVAGDGIRARRACRRDVRREADPGQSHVSSDATVDSRGSRRRHRHCKLCPMRESPASRTGRSRPASKLLRPPRADRLAGSAPPKPATPLSSPAARRPRATASPARPGRPTAAGPD